MNQKLHHKKNGFTLIEMLMVLMIVMTIMTISYFQLRTVYEERIIKQFIDEFQEDILLAQEYAISHSKQVDVSFYDEETFYDLRESGYRRLILKRSFHPHLNIRLLTITNPIMFRANGNINKAGSFFVESNQQKYKVVFQLGRGRFHVEKL